MIHFRSVFYFLFALLIFVGCSVSDNSGANSKVVFQMPKSFGNGSFTGNACFAVNITASDITKASPGNCDTQYGVFGGLIQAGEAIELETKFGSSRTIDIYLVISDNPCGPFDPNRGIGKVFGSNNVFRIGHKEGVNFDKPEVTVEMPIELPNQANSFKNILGSPASCEIGGGLNLSSIKQARIVVGNYRGTTNAGSKVQVRVLDKKIDLKNPNNFSGTYIKPVRLGVEQ